MEHTPTRINKVFLRICDEMGKDGDNYGSALKRNYDKDDLIELANNGYIRFFKGLRFELTPKGSLTASRMETLLTH